MAELRWVLTKIVVTLSRTPLHEVSDTFEFEDDGYDEMQALLEQTIVPDDMEDDTFAELASQGEPSEPALKHEPRNDVRRKSSGPAALGIVNRAGLATFLRERPFYATLFYRNGESVYVDELGKELKREQSVRHADFVDAIRLDKRK